MKLSTVKKVVFSIVLLHTTLMSQWLSAAEVRKISPEIRHERISESLWSVNVVCADVEQIRVIERIGNKGQWCAKDLPGACSMRKVKAAKKVCGTHFERRVAEYRQQQDTVVATQPTEASGDSSETINSEEQIRAIAAQADREAELVQEPIEILEESEVANNVDASLADSTEVSTALTNEMIAIEQEKIILAEKQLKLKLMELELKKRQAIN